MKAVKALAIFVLATLASAFSFSRNFYILPYSIFQVNPQNWKTSTPSPSSSPTPTKRDAMFGSRSLPKGTSSLNYGLMLDRIQQKRQNRTNRFDNFYDLRPQHSV